METRIEYARVNPEGYRILVTLDHFVKNCGLERILLELVKNPRLAD
jgi:hypothetical protein